MANPRGHCTPANFVPTHVPAGCSPAAADIDMVGLSQRAIGISVLLRYAGTLPPGGKSFIDTCNSAGAVPTAVDIYGDSNFDLLTLDKFKKTLTILEEFDALVVAPPFSTFGKISLGSLERNGFDIYGDRKLTGDSKELVNKETT